MHDGEPVALFLCTHSAVRAQIALGPFEQFAADVAVTIGSSDARPVFPGKRSAARRALCQGMSAVSRGWSVRGRIWRGARTTRA
jgi:hypothetical protein